MAPSLHSHTLTRNPLNPPNYSPTQLLTNYFPSTPQYGLGNAVAGPVWPGRAVADPIGRVTPPQIGRGRRGCGRLVATTLP